MTKTQQAKALILKFPGTNCDVESVEALEIVGFEVQLVPIALAKPEQLQGVDLVMLAGGFSYGDYVMAGRLAQLEISNLLGQALHEHHAQGGYLLGVCNGFQILMQLGLLPAGSLTENTSERFICKWSHLQVTAKDSPYTQGLGDTVEFPVAHAEGRFVAMDVALAEQYDEQGLVVFKYAENFNGSHAAIAGLQDETGRVMGLMPHPERFIKTKQHYDPDWADEHSEAPHGYTFFESIYQAITAKG